MNIVSAVVVVLSLTESEPGEEKYTSIFVDGIEHRYRATL